MKLLYGATVFILAWMVYFALSHIADREGWTGALLAPQGQSSWSLVGLLGLLLLRALCMFIIPSMLAGWGVQRALEVAHRRWKLR